MKEGVRNLPGDAAMDEHVAWARGSDDAFGDAGVGTSEPEHLRAWRRTGMEI